MPAPQLKVKDTQGRRVVTIEKPTFSIGRRSNADLQVVSTDVSREHAEIVQSGDQYVLHDRGSRYGTFVNGEAVTERPLINGDRIRLGRTDAVELVFALDLMDSSGLGDSATDITDLGQMAAILNGLRALGSGRVVDEVLTLVLDSALEVTKAERGFIMLANPQEELEFKVARAGGRLSLPGSSFTTSAKIPREVFQTGKSRIVADLMDGNLADAHEGTIAIGIRHVICVPLWVSMPDAEGISQTRRIGVLYLDGRERGSMTSDSTRSSLEAFATQAAIAIESARLYAESAEKARTDRDLRVAAEIQKALLPETNYESATAELAASSIPCRTVGGDFFDYVDIDDSGTVGFALGDVAGKGPPAALLATAVQSNFVALAPISEDPAEALTRINKALLRRAIEARFATMFYGVSYADGRLAYCNAGQEPALVVRKDGSEEWLETGGPVLGLLSIATYESGQVVLAPGDLVIVYSDGVSEARSASNEEFGRDRLLDVARSCRGQKPDAVLEAILRAVSQFSQGAAQADDITALVFRFRGR
jgi:phosphoserine phosphatase RsbU/P